MTTKHLLWIGAAAAGVGLAWWYFTKDEKKSNAAGNIIGKKKKPIIGTSMVNCPEGCTGNSEGGCKCKINKVTEDVIMHSTI